MQRLIISMYPMLVLAVALTLALCACANPESDRVHALPGWPLDLPSRMYVTPLVLYQNVTSCTCTPAS